ncbi:MAG: hypothetical protein U5R31_17125 [Acidimicrobiia bacterium]|nr:hypothetical protein [Acidimicrobiia bacterium]
MLALGASVVEGQAKQPSENNADHKPLFWRGVRGAAWLVVALGACFVGLFFWFWIGSQAPETPGNAAIDFGVSWQLGDYTDSTGRVCEARRSEFEDTSSQLHQDLKETLGKRGLSSRGYPDRKFADGTTLVFFTSGAPTPPEGEYVTPATPVFAYEMVKEGRRWKVCGIRETDETYPGFDIRVPCLPGEEPTPSPDGCREP